MRINPLLKPDPHACCPNATHLRPRACGGVWLWNLYLAGIAMPVRNCPWCGELLPNKRARARLGVIEGGK